MTGLQCAQQFKTVSPRHPDVRDDNVWFFDTELLLLSEKLGFRIKDVPVRWIDDHDTRVKIVATVIEDIQGLRRVSRYLKKRRG